MFEREREIEGGMKRAVKWTSTDVGMNQLLTSCKSAVLSMLTFFVDVYKKSAAVNVDITFHDQLYNKSTVDQTAVFSVEGSPLFSSRPIENECVCVCARAQL